MNRTRNFAAIGYPESMPEDWIQILRDTHCKFCVSPLHNLDIDDNGNYKKEHYHILLMFESVKTITQAQEIFDLIKATQCQVVNSIGGQARYLCHLDETDAKKHVYATSEVICINGADYYSLIDLPTNKYQAIKSMIDFIEYNNVQAFSDLLTWTSLNNEVWFRALCDNSSYIVKEYIQSRSWAQEKYKTNDASRYETFMEVPKR